MTTRLTLLLSVALLAGCGPDNGCQPKHEAHAPLVRTTNGDWVVVTGWDKNNKCNAKWSHYIGPERTNTTRVFNVFSEWENTDLSGSIPHYKADFDTNAPIVLSLPPAKLREYVFYYVGMLGPLTNSEGEVLMLVTKEQRPYFGRIDFGDPSKLQWTNLDGSYTYVFVASNRWPSNWHYGTVYSNVTASPIPRPRDWKGYPHVDVVNVNATNVIVRNFVSLAAMTRSHIATMQAYLDGKEIEFNPDRRGQWLDCPQPEWDFWHDEYRVKTKEP